MPKLLALKQADYSASKEDGAVSPTVEKWRAILKKMQSDGTPFTLKDLKITAAELMEEGFCGKDIGKELNKLLSVCREFPERNEKKYLLQKSKKDFGKGR